MRPHKKEFWHRHAYAFGVLGFDLLTFWVNNTRTALDWLQAPYRQMGIIDEASR